MRIIWSMEIRQTFARNLRLARQAKGVSQAELAHRAGLDRTYVSSLEREVYSPTIDVVERLAKALELDPLVLLRKVPLVKCSS
jgi:transcriptional regulator with XRE-family HTH domain